MWSELEQGRMWVSAKSNVAIDHHEPRRVEVGVQSDLRNKSLHTSQNLSLSCSHVGWNSNTRHIRLWTWVAVLRFFLLTSWPLPCHKVSLDINSTSQPIVVDTCPTDTSGTGRSAAKDTGKSTNSHSLGQRKVTKQKSNMNLNPTWVTNVTTLPNVFS